MKIAIVGEAYGEQEDEWKKPFVGKAGEVLNDLLGDAGISRSECFVTNVFNLRPDRNDLSSLCDTKTASDVAKWLPALVPGKYLKTKYLDEVTRLHDELRTLKPNLVLLLGNTACWAVLGQQSISKIRGTCSLSPIIRDQKVLPTYHPTAILRQYELRHVTVLDLIKAKREAEFPELRRPLRELWLEPSILDIRRFWETYGKSTECFSFDIETAFGQITCIGFATSCDRAIIIPFFDPRAPGGHYWKTLEEEVEAWSLVAEMLAHPKAKSIGQNTLYDIQWLWFLYGIPVPSYGGDTMLMHHALQPESPKGLGFLGSVYTNEIAWKPMRPRGKNMVKREDE